MGTYKELFDTSSVFDSGKAQPRINIQPGELITAAHYRQMLDVLEGLINHSHVFYDDYATVCDCQCQCGGGRGTV